MAVSRRHGQRFSPSRGRARTRAGAAGLTAAYALLQSGAAFAEAPVAVDDYRAIPPNTVLIMNVLDNDFDPDGDPIELFEVGQPQNGTVEITGEGGQLIYQPNPGFTGVDTFTYQIVDLIEDSSNGLGEIATAVVTIDVRDGNWDGYPDNSRNLAQALDAACEAARAQSEAALGDSGRALLQRCEELELLSVSDPAGYGAVLRQVMPDETLSQARVTSESSAKQTRAISQRIGQRRLDAAAPLTLNGGALVAARGARGGGASADEADSDLFSRFGVFASVQASGAEKRQTDWENGYDSDGFTLTAGADYFLLSKLLIGAAYSYTETDLEYRGGDGELNSELSSLLLFGSYFYRAFTFDLQAGYSATQYDSARYLRYGAGGMSMDGRIDGATEGSQWLLHGQVQWQWTHGRLSLLPFARFEWQTLSIDAYGEQGSTGLEMELAEQDVDQSSVAAGVQANYAMNFNWGVLIPNATVELWSETHSRRDALTGQFAFDPGDGDGYVLAADDTESFFSEVSIGASAVLQRGLSGFALYRQTLGYRHLDAYSVQLGIRYELGG